VLITMCTRKDVLVNVLKIVMHTMDLAEFVWLVQLSYIKLLTITRIMLVANVLMAMSEVSKIFVLRINKEI
jgi:hypothetical protein